MREAIRTRERRVVRIYIRRGQVILEEDAFHNFQLATNFYT